MHSSVTAQFAIGSLRRVRVIVSGTSSASLKWRTQSFQLSYGMATVSSVNNSEQFIRNCATTHRAPAGRQPWRVRHEAGVSLRGSEVDLFAERAGRRLIDLCLRQGVYVSPSDDKAQADDEQRANLHEAPLDARGAQPAATLLPYVVTRIGGGAQQNGRAGSRPRTADYDGAALLRA